MYNIVHYVVVEANYTTKTLMLRFGVTMGSTSPAANKNWFPLKKNSFFKILTDLQ